MRLHSNAILMLCKIFVLFFLRYFALTIGNYIYIYIYVFLSALLTLANLLIM
jgi:hypothetical protein